MIQNRVKSRIAAFSEYFSLEDAFAKHLSRSAIAAHSSHILVLKINNINERSQETVGGVNRSLRRTSRSANVHSAVIFLLSPHLGCYTVDSAIKDPALFKHTHFYHLLHAEMSVWKMF